MELTCNTLETMLLCSAEQRQLDSALATATSILRTLGTDDLNVLDDELGKRCTWCGRMTQHATRSLLRALIRVERAKRTLDSETLKVQR